MHDLLLLRQLSSEELPLLAVLHLLKALVLTEHLLEALRGRQDLWHTAITGRISIEYLRLTCHIELDLALLTPHKEGLGSSGVILDC